jgi:hypothetical protein
VQEQQTGYIQTGWQSFLPPMREGGYRTRALVQILRVGRDSVFPDSALDRPGFYQVKLKIIREINQSHHDSMNPKTALWLSEGYDLPMSHTILKAIEAKLYFKEK